MKKETLSDNNPVKGNGVMNGMNADLGLFNQLLQMVDGDWSDSIQGICNHILSRFSAMGIVLTVFDRSYDELIFIESAASPGFASILDAKGVQLNQNFLSGIIKKIYRRNRAVLDFQMYGKEDIGKLADLYFGEAGKGQAFLDASGFGTIISVPVLETEKNFRCNIFILSERQMDRVAGEHFNGYLKQLNVALEIIFLVRELYIKATHDSLTKLFNHKQGQILLTREINRVLRNRQPLTIVMADIDLFKKVNDTYGHQAGDLVLEYIASLMADSMRKCDVISRYGGEEFLLVLPDTDLPNSAEVIRRLKDTIQNHRFSAAGREFSVTVSFGITQFDRARHQDMREIIEDADSKLYRAKLNGRNRIEC